MAELITWLSSVLGVLMDLFFRFFTALGYPRLWVCIVAFAVTTRFIFLPQKIGEHRNKILMPVVNFELKQMDPEFFQQTKDKELLYKRSLLKKEVTQKYKVKNNSGCLTAIVQYPLLVALFYVVKNPQEFVPSLEAMAGSFAEVNSLLGTSLSAIPFRSAAEAGGVSSILIVPVIVMISSFWKMFPTVRRVKSVGDKIKTYTLCATFVFLLGWFSASFPLVISLYWITNDVTNSVLDFILKKVMPKTKSISRVLKDHQKRVIAASAELAAQT